MYKKTALCVPPSLVPPPAPAWFPQLRQPGSPGSASLVPPAPPAWFPHPTLLPGSPIGLNTQVVQRFEVLMKQ